ncbi:MAG TPA: hypothetical protein VK914_03660 [bacterium]|jgi:hypothetical protein|nr:hypothetical protein [bacterium]
MKSEDPIRNASDFRFSSEYGAWWNFETCLWAGLLKVFERGAALPSALALAAGMHALFLTSEWFTGLGRRGARADWGSREAWLLVAAGLALLATGVVLAPALLRTDLVWVLALWSLFAGGVLWLRVLLPSRDLRLLMASAVLLTGPTLVLGMLAFDGAVPKILGYWSLWAWYFPWGIFYIQTWLRGNTLPRWRIGAASIPFLAEAAVLACFSGWLGSLCLLLLCCRMVWRLRRRLLEFDRCGTAPRLASTPDEVRLLGYEQLAWSLVLSGIWIAS